MSVTSGTANGPWGNLIAAVLLVCEQRGRHSYYRLADDTAANALEAMTLIAEQPRTHATTWANPTRQ